MASPVDTSVKYLHSEMSGAPVLIGRKSSLNAFLHATLVTGFDLKTVTSLSVTGGVARVLYSAPHSAEVESVILIDGITGALASLNGEQKITAKPAAGELQFKTTLADGTATGTITIKMAPLGWSRVYQEGDVSVYKSNDVMSSGHCLRVDDTDAMHVRVLGYETMSDANTGTGRFPLTSQVAGPTPALGGYWSKGSNASDNPIGWTFFGDTRFFMYGPKAYQSQYADANSRAQYGLAHLRGFGDPLALRPSGDPYGTVLGCGISEDHYYSTNAGVGSFSLGIGASLFTPRNFTGLGTSTPHHCFTYASPMGVENLSGCARTYHGDFPSPIDGGLRLSGRFMRNQGGEPANCSVRADIPGILYVPMGRVAASLPAKTVIKGTGKWLGRSLVAVAAGDTNTSMTNSPDASGITFVDITGPWR